MNNFVSVYTITTKNSYRNNTQVKTTQMYQLIFDPNNILPPETHTDQHSDTTIS